MKGLHMKKATSKRERKYGKQEAEPTAISKEKKDKSVRVMVDGAHILKFPNRKKAEIFIKKKLKEAEELRRPEPSLIYI